MKITTDIKELEKILRREIITQSEIPASFVRNALDEYGTAPDKTVNGTVFNSITPFDCAIIFELIPRTNNADGSFSDEHDNVIYYKSFAFYVKIYGDDSANVANKTIGRMRTEKARRSLESQGIHVERVTDADGVHEFINSRIWQRNDFQIDFTVKLSFEQINPDAQIEAIKTLEIIKI